MNLKTIRDHLLQLRRRDILVLAQKAGLHHETLQRLKFGRCTNPTIGTLEKIHAAMPEDLK